VVPHSRANATVKGVAPFVFRLRMAADPPFPASGKAYRHAHDYENVRGPGGMKNVAR